MAELSPTENAAEPLQGLQGETADRVTPWVDEISQGFGWDPPAGMSPELEPMVKHFARRGLRNEYLGQRYDDARRLWVLANFSVGGLAALLAAASGSVGLTSLSPLLAAGLAFGSAAAGGVLAFVNPAAQIENAKLRANAHWRISQWAWCTLLTDIPGADAKAMAQILRELERREADLLDLPDRGSLSTPGHLSTS